MRFLLLLLILIFSTFTSIAEVYWANEVVGYSSQKSFPEYGATQILGKPSIMSDFGKSECAWMPNNRGFNNEWIRVKFPKKITIRQIVIHENLFPGAITRIVVYDSLDRGTQVFTSNFPHAVQRDGRLLYIEVPPTEFASNELKIEINLSKYLDEYQIDAVGISDIQSIYQIEVSQALDTLQFEPENLGEQINSKYRELVPVISADDSLLYFVRAGHPENIGAAKLQDIWFAKKMPDGNFTTAQNIGFPINNNENNFIISSLPDGNTLIIGSKYNIDGTLEKGISKTQRKLDGWSFPDTLAIKNFYNFNMFSSYSMSSSGKILLMSLERKDTYGIQDIYVSFLNDNGTWTEPKNLGNVINTAAPEVTPFIASDEKTLYFSTSGRPGFGMHDMFVSKRLDDSWQSWSEPLNLGNRLNTSNWDAYYTVPASGNYAYFVSAENSFGQEDIFRVKLHESVKPEYVVLIKGIVYDAKKNQPIEAKIIYEDLTTGIESGIAHSNPETGEYSIVLPAGKKYGFLAEQAGYLAQNENLDLTNLQEYKELNKNLYLIPIEKGQTIRINNIFFDFGDYNLLNESYPELNRLADFLNENPEKNISIIGHTDNIGTVQDNTTLSLKRANAVAEFLVNKGIEKKRLFVKGMGALKPIAPNSTEEGRQQNRRVEFTILN